MCCEVLLFLLLLFSLVTLWHHCCACLRRSESLGACAASHQSVPELQPTKTCISYVDASNLQSASLQLVICVFAAMQSTLQRVGNRSNIADMACQPFYKWIQETYTWHVVGLFAVLYALGGFPAMVWGGALRIAWVYHITWFVNSASHCWGYQSYNTGMALPCYKYSYAGLHQPFVCAA